MTPKLSLQHHQFQRLQKTHATGSLDSEYPISTTTTLDYNTMSSSNNNGYPPRYSSNSNIQAYQHKFSASRLPTGGNNLLSNLQSGAYQMTRNSPQRATVTKKTRTYVVDGIEGTDFITFIF